MPKNRTVDRAIFSGKRLSLACRLPYNENLVSYRELFRRLEEVANAGNGNVWAVTGDFRNYFHQLSYDSDEVGRKKDRDHSGEKDTARFFGLACNMGAMGIQFFKWLGVPMGHSWSPALAQACAWTVLTAARAGETNFFRPADFEHAMPHRKTAAPRAARSSAVIFSRGCHDPHRADAQVGDTKRRCRRRLGCPCGDF